MKKLIYRPEIDGLRALAVFSVILYHAKFQIGGNDFLTGGYLGVDIFFVISGYLITSILLNEFAIEKNISIKDFYIRRARRILPALFFLIIILLLISLFSLPPYAQINFAKSVISVIFFISNFFFFFNQDSYFSESSEYMQLLHTWSLSVEEQFYLIFPLILLFILKKEKKFILFFFIFILIISLILSIVFSFSSNPQISSLNFYLFPTRAWELLIGCTASILSFKLKLKLTYFKSSLLVLVGLLMIFYSIFYYNANMQLPSYQTLIPVLGTLIIILIKEDNFFYKYLLHLKPIVFIGLISYSLYLWHYPLFVLSKSYYFLYSNFANQKVLMILLSVLVSIFSYFVIEKPFRDKKLVDLKKFLKVIFTSIILIILFCFIILVNKGIKIRYNNFFVKYPLYVFDNNILLKEWGKPLDGYYFTGSSKFEDKSKKNVLIIGNSHSIGVFRMFHLNKNLFPNYEFSVLRIGIKDFKKEYEKNQIIKNSDLIILASRWTKKSYKDIEKYNNLIKNSNKKLLVFLNRPEFEDNVYNSTLLDNRILKKLKNNKKIDEKFFYNSSKLYFSKINKKKEILNEKMKKYLINLNIKFYDPKNYSCNYKDQICDIVTVNKEKIYFDYAHYTLEGSKHFGEKSNLKNILNYSINTN